MRPVRRRSTSWTDTTPPLTAAIAASTGPQYDIIDQRCNHRHHDGDTRVYRMSGHCTNCGTRPLVGLFTAGHESTGYHGPCPACGCRSVQWDKLADLDPDAAL